MSMYSKLHRFNYNTRTFLEVANKAQVLINQFGYYQFLNLVDFMQRNPGAVSFGS
jgi:hypothetical protein